MKKEADYVEKGHKKAAVLLQICLVMFVVFLYGKSTIAYGEAFSSDISPKEFYETYGSNEVYNTIDDSIYWALKSDSKGYSASTGFQRKAIRYTLSGSSYYVDTCSDDSAYNDCQELIDGNDYYNMARVKLATILGLFAEKYPSVDFAKYFSGRYTIEIDALMSIRVNNIYQCYDDLKDGTTDRGVITSAKAKSQGKSAYTGLYTTASAMRNAYTPYANVNFELWYDRLIDVTPNNPAAGVDYDIKVDNLTITGGNNYKYNDNTYYVKALKDFTLSFASRTYQNGIVKANATYQPSLNGIISTQKISENYQNVPVYKYFTSPFGANIDTFTISNTYTTVYNTVGVTQNRSANLTTLSTTVTMNMDELDYVPVFASMSRLVVAGKTVKTATSPSIKIIPDGTAPAINGIMAPSEWIKADKYQFNVSVSDNLSGVKGIKGYTDDILTHDEAVSNMTYRVTGAGLHKVYIEAEDNVGNINSKSVTVKLDNIPPSVVMKDKYEIEEGDVTGDILIIDIPMADEHSGVVRVEVYDSEGSIVAYKIFNKPVNNTRFNLTISGENCIGEFNDYTVKAWDAAGNEGERSVKIKYNKKVFVKPTVVGTH